MQEKLSLKVLKSFNELETIREEWNNLVQHPNAMYDFYKTIIESREDVVSPCVFLVYKDEKIISMVLSRIENSYSPIRIGYLKLLSPRVKSLEIIYGGFIGDISMPTLSIIFKELENLLRNKSLDIINCHMLKNGSNTYEFIKMYLREHRIQFLNGRRNIHRTFEIPDSVDIFYSTMKRKHRTFYKNLEKSFNGNVNFEVYKDDVQFDKMIDDLEHVAKVSYQRGLGVGFEDTPEYRNRFKLLTSQGILRVYLLYINTQPCAYWTGTIFKNVCHLYEGAYDSAFSKYSPGICLFYKLVEDLINNKDVHTLDFGFGEAHYKERFGTDMFYETTLILFAPTLRMNQLYRLHRLSKAISRYSECMLDKLRIKDKVKKLWRSRLRVN